MNINLINMGAVVGINFAVAILCFLFGYLCGSIPTAVIIGKVFFHKDPRKYGSKNAGGTNMGRLFGKKVGLLVIILDMIKGVTPIWICWAILTFVPMLDGHPLLCPAESFYTSAKSSYVITWSIYWLAALGCTIGHCWPIFARFKGGKGFSGYIGTLLTTSWFFGWLVAAFYFPLLKWKKYVSLCAIVTCTLAPLMAWLLVILNGVGAIPSTWGNWGMYGNTLVCDWFCALCLTFMSIIVITRHSGNIQRLKEGTERKITWMK